MSMNQSTDSEREAMFAAFEARNAAAQATPCGIDGCDGSDHDGAETPEQWSHRVLHSQFDGRVILFDITRGPDGTHTGNISMEAEGDVTAAQLRADADLYESLPGWLRDLAGRLDTLNGVSK